MLITSNFPLCFAGGIFRRVALSGLLESSERPNQRSNKSFIPSTRIVRHASRVMDPQDHKESETFGGGKMGDSTMMIVDETDKSGRKSFFKKKSTVKKVPSSQSMFDDEPSLSVGGSMGSVTPQQSLKLMKTLGPRLSVGPDGGDNLSLGAKSKSPSGSKLQLLNWFKGASKGASDQRFREFADTPTPPTEVQRVVYIFRQADQA